MEKVLRPWAGGRLFWRCRIAFRAARDATHGGRFVHGELNLKGLYLRFEGCLMFDS
jgi:hypothetical protein